MNYPCDFIVKIFGRVGTDLEASIRPVLESQLHDIQSVEISKKFSNKQNFESISVKFHATDQEQVDNLYRAVKALPSVLMVL